jgi:hypothetical protein
MLSTAMDGVIACGFPKFPLFCHLLVLVSDRALRGRVRLSVGLEGSMELFPPSMTTGPHSLVFEFIQKPVPCHGARDFSLTFVEC